MHAALCRWTEIGLTAREPLEIFRADGSSVAALQEGQSIGLDSGVYLCRSRKGNVKFIIR